MNASPFRLDAAAAYARWREHKLARYPRSVEELIVEIRDPHRLSPAEHEALRTCMTRANMAVYVVPRLRGAQADAHKLAARALGTQCGLHTLDVNYLADEDGFSPLACVEGGVRGEFIPYTNRAIRWHTDGYYNPPGRTIRAMVLHCVQRAEEGGVNRLLDHELLYLQLRDANPEFIRALMAPDAMTIPARSEDGVEARADQAGPVFSLDAGGHLHMRYTARTRSICWKDDAPTRAAVETIETSLAADPRVLTARLEPAMGLLCNNVLHDRSAFTDSARHKRLILRGRFHERVTPAERCAAAA